MVPQFLVEKNKTKNQNVWKDLFRQQYDRVNFGGATQVEQTVWIYQKIFIVSASVW